MLKKAFRHALDLISSQLGKGKLQIAPDNAPVRYIKKIYKNSEEPSQNEDMALGDPNNIIC
jgi:hypothetical protein